MQTIKISLGGREYELRPLPIRKAREIREKFTESFEQIVDAINQLPNLALDDVHALGDIVTAVKDVLLGSVELVLEILFAYSPELAADRERIEAEAYDEEAIAAFVEVVKLLYPFGSLANVLSGLGKR